MTFKYFEIDPALTAWSEAIRQKHLREREEALSTHPEIAEVLEANRVARERRGDVIDMPSHYTQLPVEAIDITEHFNFTMGNAIKYIWRADHKGKPVEDLKKARWYIDREIERRERAR